MEVELGKDHLACRIAFQGFEQNLNMDSNQARNIAAKEI